MEDEVAVARTAVSLGTAGPRILMAVVDVTIHMTHEIGMPKIPGHDERQTEVDVTIVTRMAMAARIALILRLPLGMWCDVLTPESTENQLPRVAIPPRQTETEETVPLGLQSNGVKIAVVQAAAPHRVNPGDEVIAEIETTTRTPLPKTRIVVVENVDGPVTTTGVTVQITIP